jgi:hypothetical protein
MFTNDVRMKSRFVLLKLLRRQSDTEGTGAHFFRRCSVGIGVDHKRTTDVYLLAAEIIR